MTDKDKDPADAVTSSEAGNQMHQHDTTIPPVRQRHALLICMYNYAVGRRRARARLETAMYEFDNAERMRHGQGRKSHGL